MTTVRQSHWVSQGPVTEPGPAAKAIDELPADIAALCQASSQLVFHCDPAVLAELGARDGLRVPQTVTSFGPMGGPPREVDVSRALGR